jgi:elongation factor P
MSFVRPETGRHGIMASIQATRLRKGMLVKQGNDLFRVLDLQHVTPGNLRGFVRARFRNIRNGSLSDQKLRSEDSVERAVLDEREMQYMYRDGESFHFMDTETYEQLHIDSEVLGDAASYIVAEATIKVEFYGSEPVGIELPLSVDLKVTDTVPGIKGATASAQVKPATLETGLVVQVPPFIDVNDVVRVNTETGEYLKKL